MRLKENINRFFINYKVIIAIYSITALVTAIQKYYLNNYNVFLCYKYSALNLVKRLDLYFTHTGVDAYMYSPTFSAFFLIFAYIPDVLGAIFWNLTSALLLIYSVNLLNIDKKNKILILYIIFIEATTCLQNYQANIFATAIILFTYDSFIRNKYLLAGLFSAFGFYVKIFGVGFGILFIFFKGKIRFLIYFTICFVLLFLLPLIFVNFDFTYLIHSYISWSKALSRKVSNDPDHYINFFTILDTWFHVKVGVGSVSSKYSYLVQAISLIITLFPLLRFSLYKDKIFKLLFLSSLLIWVVIFNPKGESPTYIIAMTGVAIWFVAQRINWFNISLLIFAICFTSLIATDIFKPITPYLPYGMKAFPCLIIWIIIQFQLWTLYKNRQQLLETN